MRIDRRRLLALTLALVALLLQGATIAHQHLGAQPGFFNHDHDLNTLATMSGGLVPAGPDPAPIPSALALHAAPTGPAPALTPERHPSPRAPPLVEPPLHS